MATGELITIGTVLPAGGGQDCFVEEFLGGGGQGEVYRVRIGAEQLALKWYFAHNQKIELKNSLEELIKRGAPNDKFLWPKQIIEYEGFFGYTMGLRPPEYQKSQKMLDRTFSLSYKTAANACLQLADCFRQLHVKGLSYQDLNWGNLFINPSTGDILVCDNDNVAPHGASVAGIVGTYGFMAPEVVRGEHTPDTYTDLFSLAVLMFRVLFIEHPFDGKRWVETQVWDDNAKKKFYGKEPVFIFDPNNDSNRPVAGVQDNAEIFWEMYPRHIRDNFTKVFTTGLTDRENGRLLEEDWIDAFRKLQETIFSCSHCSAEVVYDLDLLKQQKFISCWKAKCQGHSQQLAIPPRLRIKAGSKDRFIILNHDTKLFHYQLVRSEPDLAKGGEIAGEMVQNPNDPSKWGIKNKTNENWQYTTANGDSKDVAPDKALSLTSNVKEIDFKTARAEIKI